MKQGVITDELVGKVTGGLAPGEFAHGTQVLGALGVQHVLGAAAGQQGEHDLGEQRVL